MSRTYQVLRNNSNFQGMKKVWVLNNKRGAKKFQRMMNKRCRRLDKVAIAEGINEMIDNAYDAADDLEDLFDWYEEDYFEEPSDWDEEDSFEDLWEDLRDWDDEYHDSLYY